MHTDRLQRLDTVYNARRVVALRYRISSLAYCPWLVAIGEEVLPANAKSRGHLLSRLYAQEATR